MQGQCGSLSTNLKRYSLGKAAVYLVSIIMPSYHFQLIFLWMESDVVIISQKNLLVSSNVIPLECVKYYG